MSQHAAGLPRVQIHTRLGPITVEVDTVAAPITAGNFLHLVDRRLYDGARFYRSVRGENDPNPESISVIQGGLYGLGKTDVPDGISHEDTRSTGLKHAAGTISMARDAVGTADSEFFIVVEDSPALDAGGKRQPDGHGFAAFGRVVEGLDTVRSIATGATRQDTELGGELEAPVAILSMSRLPVGA